MPFKAQEGKYTYYAFTDLDSAAVCAKKRNQQLLVIFDGYVASSMPNREWAMLDSLDNEKLIKDNYVIVWLPVDDKTKLKDTSATEEYNGKISHITTVGRKNALLQIKLFQNNAHPFFCIMNSDLRPIGKTMSYSRDKKEIEEFIKSGLK